MSPESYLLVVLGIELIASTQARQVLCHRATPQGAPLFFFFQLFFFKMKRPFANCDFHKNVLTMALSIL